MSPSALRRQSRLRTDGANSPDFAVLPDFGRNRRPPSVAPVWLTGRADGEGDGDRGAGGVAVQADQVGELVDDPQPVGVLALPLCRVRAGVIPFRRAVVADREGQRLAVCPQAQPPVVGAVA